MLIFFGLTLGISIWSFSFSWTRSYSTEKNNKKDLGPNQSFFSNIRFYQMENFELKVHLKADELSILEDKEKVLTFISPSGRAFPEDQVPVDFEGAFGIFQDKKEFLALKKEVILRRLDTIIEADRLEYFINKGIIKAFDGVKTRHEEKSLGDKVTIRSQEMTSLLEQNFVIYQGNVQGKIDRRRSWEQPLSFKTNKLEMDRNELVAHLEGDVLIKKQDLTARSLKGQIFLENYNKKLKYFVLSDDVVVNEKVMLGRELMERRALAERLEGFMSKNLIVLTGNPRVIQQGDTIIGNRILLRQNKEVVEVEDANSKFNIR